RLLGLGREGLSFGNVFESNVLWFDQGNLGERADRGPITNATRRNLIWNAGSGGVNWPLGSLAAEQAAGRWMECIEADPLLADPVGGDFTPGAESPALALGFVPFDWRQAGPRAPLPSDFGDYPLPVTEPIAAAVARIDDAKIVAVGSGHRVDAVLVVQNPSRRHAAGEYRLVIRSAGPEAREWPLDQVPVDLAPGAEIFLPMSFPVPSGFRKVWLAALGDERTLFSGAFLACVPVDVEIPALREVPEEGLGRFLGEASPIEIVHAGTIVLAARFGLAGECLVLKGDITEKHPQRDDLKPWEASSVEIFLAADSDIKAKPLQYFLLPPENGDGGSIRGVNGSRLPDLTSFQARTTPEGWAFELSMPLGMLGIAPPVRAFRFDMICNVKSSVAGQNLLHLPVWGMSSNHTDAGLLARILPKFYSSAP
ncbi:MAG: hypothetical protein ACOYM3_21530, partial [Terrimicrobiaceae bacterium]